MRQHYKQITAKGVFKNESYSRSVRTRNRTILKMPRSEEKHASIKYRKFCGKLQGDAPECAQHVRVRLPYLP